VRKLSDAQRAALSTAVEQLALTAAREIQGLEPEAGLDSGLPDADPQHVWLAALASLQAIRESAEQLAASAALSAAQHGADYPEIGDAAETSRQGARRRWPGLAGLSDGRQRMLNWWNHRGAQLTECVEAVLATTEGQQEKARLENLSTQLGLMAAASSAQRIDMFDTVLIEAHAVALCAPAPTNRVSALAIGLLSALTADAYAVTNTHSSLGIRHGSTCETPDCASGPVVDVLVFDVGWQAIPACHKHAVEALQHLANRIVIAYQPDVALAVFTEARSE
jgi:hypothetical protein